MLKKAAKPENAQPAARRKLTRAERKQIEAIIRQAKGDGKPHTVQDSIPFRNLYPDGLCRLDDRLFSKTIAYEDVNYRLAGPDDQRDIFERLCDFYNGYDPSIGLVRKYTRARKLTPRMLNELVEKIEVFNAEKIDGVWEQRLRIHYNCVGTIEIPTVLPLPIPEVSVNTRKGVVVNYAPCELAV